MMNMALILCSRDDSDVGHVAKGGCSERPVCYWRGICVGIIFYYIFV